MAQEKFLLVFILTFLFHNLSLSTHDAPSPSIFDGEGVWGVASPQNVFNVEDFGAKGDGTDDSKAFEAAWKQACSTTSPSLVLVAKSKSYTLKPVEFRGPCKAPVTVSIEGRLEAPSELWNADDNPSWIMFNTTENLAVQGGGTLDGKGQVWWKNSCKIDPSLPCHDAPTALLFRKCDNLAVEDITVRDGQQIHVWFRRCNRVNASKIQIYSPGDSPNTDGIHITDTHDIAIKDSIIGTGDDCISVVSGTRGLYASGIECGPGHGVSIGSLGAKKASANVSDVVVDNLKLKGTTNGVRIKTWQGGRGYARDITFQNVIMDNVKHPIIINQNYCDQDEPCFEQDTAVAVSNVYYKNIRGTSASEVAINLNCSRAVPCSQISLENINLVGEEDPVTSECTCVDWKQIGNVIPTPCT